mgnify:CR=1 FL=1
MIENLSFADNLVLLLYFLIVLFIGIISGQSKDRSVKDYFLASKQLSWFAIGASLFATNISSEHLVGLAGAGASRGLSVGHFEWIAIFILFFLGWVIAPIFIKSNVYTVPEFFGKRFDNRSRKYLTWVSIGTYLFTKIGVTIIAAGYLLNRALGWDMFASTVFIVLITGLYTVIGGLNSVVKTQIFQTFVLIAGSILLIGFGINAVGGISALANKMPQKYFEIFKPINDPDFPWTGIILGAPILGIWYWCTDQYIVQRVLAAKNISSVKKGTLFAAVLKIFPVLLFIIPGIIAVILYPEVRGDEAYGYLLSGGILPSGIKGIVVAGLFAAVMSSLASAFNSAATLIAIDVFKPRKPNASENELVLIGRLTTTAFVLFTIALVPLLRMINSQIYIYLQALQAFISPPIASAFILGVFWTKANSQGAFWGLIIGGIIGFLRICITWLNPETIKNFYILNFINEINYLHFAIFLFFFSASITIVISLVSKKSEVYSGQKKLAYTKNDVKINILSEIK